MEKQYLKKCKRDYIRRRMVDEITYIHDTKFEGNILIVGRKECGKTTFVQIFWKKTECLGS